MKRVLILSVLLLSGRCAAQPSDSLNADSDSVGVETTGTETYLEKFETESDDLSLLDDLTWRQEHPYDLNMVTQEELESLPGITPHDASEVISFRNEAKHFKAVHQLQEIEGIGNNLYEKLSPYVTVSAQAPVMLLRSRTSRDLQPRRGHADGTFLGSPLKTYSRLSIEAGDLQLGGVFEKDAGERMSNGFVSGYASVNDVGFVSHAVVGDFNVEAGQGLVFWKGSSFGKGGEAVSVVKKSGMDVQPSRSTDEFNYFRGVAATASFRFSGDRLTMSSFYSRRKLDGSIDAQQNVTSFYDAGLFQTGNDIEKRGTVTEQLLGGHMEYANTGGWKIGTSLFRSTFDKPVVSNRMYDFSGREQSVVGVDAAMNVGRISAFGEVAHSMDKGIAGIVGAILNFGRKSNVALVYRDYGKAFNNSHANSFGEHSDARNERGFYVGADVSILSWLRFSGYVDHFKFPWRTFFNPLPTSGRDVLLQSDVAISSRLDLTGRFSSNSVEGAETDFDVLGRKTTTIVNRMQEKYRFTATYKVSPRVSLKGRMEFTRVDYPLLHMKERGYLLFQDIRYKVSGGLSVEGRLVFFETDSYDSRLYEYENDLRGAFSNPALYGKGRRWYLVVRYTVAQLLTLSAKYSETQKEGVTSLGTGPSEINGDTDNRLAVQVDFRL